ncbi:polysaccharide pyruvyl transferase CsaB [Aureibacillus halotolerans]|uniref:Polysaccharide pyruvyl transferase CsaB n=1 Tax=Aureibacillus halotolerans TaxID=1508390 RepID=A0A4R6TUS2_9BACI|nr:polysaccharide pyruvyl transferase CsaB [Aureibacillus halotolerans]TDQ36916.1 polysaccharide pyruvyl transferase CsaB [Aureibacillus halotolerans]
MKIVMSGYFGFDNMGDEAILYSIIHALRKQQPNVDITVLSNQPEKTAAEYGVQAINRWKIRDVFKAIRASDGLISGGGSLLQDVTSAKTVPYYAGIMMLAAIAKKPIVIYAQGIGPLNSLPSKRISASVMKKAALITVRDQSSCDLLRSIGVKKPIDIVPDPVLGMKPKSTFPNAFHAMEIQQKVILVSVRDWSSEEPYLDKIAEVLDRLHSDGYAIALLPVHGEHDLKTSQALAEKMTNAAIMLPHDASLEEKLAMVRDSTLLIGMRLHALIFAAAADTPFIGVSYDPKIDAFCQQVKQPIIGHVNDAWTAEQLYMMTVKQLNDPNTTSELQKVTLSLKTLADETATKALGAMRT